MTAHTSEAPAPTAGSLADRMARRRKALEARKTKMLPIPGWEGILTAEYRLLGWQTLSSIQTRNENELDDGLQTLYNAADTLIAACTEVYEIPEDGSAPRALGERWIQLAERAGAVLPEGCTERQAMFTLFVHDIRVIEHYRQYERWARGADGEIDDEVVSDFEVTASR